MSTRCVSLYTLIVSASVPIFIFAVTVSSTFLFSFFFSSRRRHTRWNCDWSSDVCSSDLPRLAAGAQDLEGIAALQRIRGKDRLPHRPVHRAFLREPRRVRERLRRVRQPGLHLGGAEEGALGPRQVLARHAVQRRVPRDRAP